MSFLTLDGVAFRTPEGRALFSELSLSIGRERIGLVGRNGCGKSTLLGAIAEGRSPSAGHIALSGTAGLLAQDWPGEWSLGHVLGVAEPLACLARILAGEGSEEDFAAADWTLEERLAAILDRLGLPGLALERRVTSLSGGERTRVGLARVLLEAPDLLLLDEPTNNLDADGWALVAQVLGDWPGGVLVASHDRALLEGMDRIVELTPTGVRTVTGGWSQFAAIRAAERQRAEAELERAEADLGQVRRAAQAQKEAKATRDKAGRAFAAGGSQAKVLLGRQAERAQNSGGTLSRQATRQKGEAEDRLAQARGQVEVRVPVRMEVPPAGLPANAQVLSLQAVSLMREGRPFGPWSLDIKGPRRIAVIGANGAGKTTLLRLAVGDLMPETGSAVRAEGRVAWFDQHLGQLAGDADILTNYRRLNPGAQEERARAAIARFGFRGEASRQLVGTLSGGERLRAGLACILGGVRAPWLLVMDEPTNHLDIESVELLEGALRDYDGALLVVSHDQAFLEAIGIEEQVEIGR
ncbi:ABC-F family ATP-binding cassette domain-containing protein [Novosphingobium mangrovi (ex Hu et al. 2023)]|uniref:ATP-binding cassette domain-containing protein n=1 Tax=Novosphingobium mangrovi (ex Hu et al. 2023) TaxID=2930094 RepID=A0ABT0ADF0_9SPHN|nr:ABC-F family ATP-binding cassette domain-containing protein [Novosphingobium mangrovi (ex Hu et al. 2023)]MCJ1961233.1 ATP-binding cassette domain-containing protein [Novosphingobium mangrovi (ex Hu et al. 2023)]